ncbi:MAG: bile acid:sodium symporter [Myxococcales bacterium]|nr:bile acid:sodium symporter [Myxococcales bacterium]
MDTTQLLGPIVLFLLMIIVGLQLTPPDFRRVLSNPRVVVVGTLGQLLLLPLMTWAVISVLGLSPIFGAGAVILAASPGAGMSNIMTAVAGAHVALSVTLTAVSSVLAVVTLPALTALGMEFFIGDAANVEVPVAYLVRQMALFLLLPIGMGMAARAWKGDAALRYVSWANRIAIIAIILLTFTSALGSQTTLPSGDEFTRALLAGSLWTVAAMGIGWGLATLLKLDADDRFTFLIEFSARNIALAFIVAVSSLGRLDLGFFSGAYAATGFPAAIAISVIRGRLRARREPKGNDVQTGQDHVAAEPPAENVTE